MTQGRTRLPLATDDWDRVWGDQLIRAIDQNFDQPISSNNVTFLQPGAGAIARTAQSKIGETKSVADYSSQSVADAVTFSAKIPLSIPTNVTSSLAASQMNGPYRGNGGQVTDNSGNNRAPFFSALKSAPSKGNWGSPTTAFNGDLSSTQMVIEYRIVGANTLGLPSTGYDYTFEAAPLTIYGFNQSGYNASTSTNDGRTGAALINLKVDNYGQGDYSGIFISSLVAETKAGATHFLANPAAPLFAGQAFAAANGAYLQGLGDINCDDQGFDVAAGGLVLNMLRSNNTGALGVDWFGVRVQSASTKAIGAAFSAVGTGGARIGLHLNGLTLGAEKAAITLESKQRIYGNSTAGDIYNFPRDVSVGTSWIEYDATSPGWVMVAGNVPSLLAQPTQVALNVPLVPQKATVAALGSAVDGSIAYATNGRKPGEGVGAGTGMPVFWSGSNWYKFDGTIVTV